MKKIDKSKIQTWFVTGASSGVGHEMTRQLLERGYNVIAVSRRVPDFMHHPNALCLSVDVTKSEEIAKAVQLGVKHFGRIDVLSNNAGVSAAIVCEDETSEHMREVMEVNYWGTFNTIKELLPHFRKNKNGTIINNSSMSGLVSRYGGSAYNSSKYAVEGLTGSIRIETQKFCRVMCFELGWFADTEIGLTCKGIRTSINEYKGVKDFYGFPKYRLKNNLKIAIKNIIDEAENEKMHHRLMLGADCLHRVKAEMKIRLDDWNYSRSKIPQCTEKIKTTKKEIGINVKNLIQTLFSVKNEKEHKVLTILGVKMKFRKTEPTMFEKRNTLRNAQIQVYGLHYLKTNKNSKKKNQQLEKKLRFKEKLSYYFLHKISIPQIEFTLTTKCTLNCRNCTNYIPRLAKDEHVYISFEEFKTYLDNLTRAVDKIYNLLLIGGEPLLVKDLDKYLEYAAKNKKVKNIWITTNGTLLMSENLIKTVKKYNKKVTIWLSNYSANEELAPVLKHEKLLEQIKLTGADLVYNKDLHWSYVSEDFSANNRSKSENIKYFETCLHTCLAVFGDKLFVCPRAGVFYQKKLYEFDNGECVSLKNKNRKELKKQIIDFYSRDYFGACDFCNILDDRLQPRIMPALQLTKKENQKEQKPAWL